MSTTYAEKLKDQRWQKKRLELLEAANWECRSGFCENPKPNPTLHVHHKLYIRKTDPWDYEDWVYAVLCDECHDKAQREMEEAHAALARNADLMAVCSMVNDMPEELQQEASNVMFQLFGRGARTVPNLLNFLKSVDSFETAVAGSAFAFANEQEIIRAREEK